MLSGKRLAGAIPLRSATVHLFDNAEIILLDYSLRGKVYTKIKIDNPQDRKQ